MKPHLHAHNSVRKWGGRLEDYMDIHEFIDSSKAHIADHRHRLLLHSTFGIYLAQQMFGLTRINSDGRIYAVRDIAEDHVIEDLGTIPSVEKWLANVTIEQLPAFARGRVSKSKMTIRVD
jgi:hypothetical protein